MSDRLGTYHHHWPFCATNMKPNDKAKKKKKTLHCEINFQINFLNIQPQPRCSPAPNLILFVKLQQTIIFKEWKWTFWNFIRWNKALFIPFMNKFSSSSYLLATMSFFFFLFFCFIIIGDICWFGDKCWIHLSQHEHTNKTTQTLQRCSILLLDPLPAEFSSNLPD